MPASRHIQAQSVISEIAKKADPKRVSEAAAHMIAEDLNWSSHHFLHELLQNADDSSFGELVEPVLTLAYAEYLRLYCNENGFSREDVEAICDFGRSTKQGSAATTGEKGIGFKSVFRVAEAVWIASGEFVFVLRKTNVYGPEVFELPFPDGSMADEDGTFMCFKIADDRVSVVCEALKTFDVTNMVFLKKLKQIEIKVDGSIRRIRRKDLPVTSNTRHITILENEVPQIHYKTLEFDFAINADFALTASRENIHRDSEWNQALRDKICDKFIEAVTILNDMDSDVRYSWPLLLNFPSRCADHFFGPAVDKMVNKLTQHPVLRNENGDKARPGSLIRVPDKYRLGEDRRPPFPTTSAKSKYLSHMYDHYCNELCGELLNDIGVKEMDRYRFKRDLKQFMDSQDVGGPVGPGDVAWHSRPDAAWHSDIANIIVGSNLQNFLKDVTMIPVQDCNGNPSWMAADVTGNLFLGTENDSVNPLPRGIGLRYIPWEAHQYGRRRRLFEVWGAQDPVGETGIENIAKKIRDAHSTANCDPSMFTIEDLISHVRFLYRNRERQLAPKNLWVFSQSNELKPCSETFIRPPVFANKQLMAPVLHENYCLDDNHDLLHWMRESFQLQESPRLVSWNGTSFSLSPEATSLIQRCDSLDVLEFLRQHYSKWLDRESESFQAHIRRQVVSIKIRCQDGALYPLNETIFPSDDLHKLCCLKPLPLLPISKQQKAAWGFLTGLGVKLQPHASYWIDCLRALRSRDGDFSMGYTTLELVKSVYSGIEESCRTNLSNNPTMRSQFETEDLIFIPSMATLLGPRPDTWVNASRCIWDSPKDVVLRHHFALSSIFCSHEYLFLIVLGIEKIVTWKRFRDEVMELNKGEGGLDRSNVALHYLAQLLMELSRKMACLSADDRCKELKILKTCQMLPIRGPNSTGCFDKLVPVTASEVWFIADREHVAESFGLELPLLALSIEQVEGLEELLSSLGLDRRRLSHRAVASSVTQTHEDEIYAVRLKERAEFIDRLTTESLRRRLPAMRKMEIMVHTSDEVSVRWEVSGYRSKATRRVAVATVSRDFRRGTLDIYMQKDHVPSPQALLELADDLCVMFRISATRRLLLQFVLASDDLDEIKRTLADRRIPELPRRDDNASETEDVSEEVEPAEPPRSAEARDMLADGVEDDNNFVSAELDGQATSSELSRTGKETAPHTSGEEVLTHYLATRTTGNRNVAPESSWPLHPNNFLITSTLAEPADRPRDSVPIETDRFESFEDSERYSPNPQKLPLAGYLPKEEVQEDNDDAPHNDEKYQNKCDEQLLRRNFLEASKKVPRNKLKAHTATRIRASSATAHSEEKATDASRVKRISSPARAPVVASLHRVNTLSSWTGTSLSEGPSTNYVEKGDRGKFYSPPRSTQSRTRSYEESFMSMDKGWITVPHSMTIFYGDDTKDTRYFGELYVSRYLETFLGEGVYLPQEHWTSPLRSWDGIPQYKEGCCDTSTFTIKNTRGKLRDAIIRCEHIHSDMLADCVTVHIEVCPTNGELDSHFVLPMSQYRKLKTMHLRDKKKAVDVYILARVYRVWENPGIAMFADPWQLEQDGSITLDAVMDYTGCIGKSAPIMLAEEFASISMTAGTSRIYNGLAVGPGKIRLLKLQHVDDDSKPLSGSLEIAEVNELKPDSGFWAISYVWGRRPEGPNPSTFTTERGTIPITESLSSCLKCLRRKRVDARIWADALCINQQDSAEKSIQVRRLGALYDKAARVIVWLGNDRGMDEPSPEIERLADLHKSLCSPGNRCRTGRGAPAANPNTPAKADKLWGGVSQLLKRPWFTRAWVVQELTLGRDVYIMSGRSEMPWDCFMESLLERERHPSRGRGGGDRTPAADAKHETIFLEGSAAAIALHRTRQAYHQAKKKTPFLRLLEMFAYTNSSRSRDKMFSLLNLASDSYLLEKDFDPDYISDDETIMEKYARGFIRHGEVLNLLYHAGHGKSASFCSWIPDFMGLRFPSGARQRTYPPTISTWTTRGGGGFYAGPRRPPQAEVRDNPQSVAVHRGPILVIRGHLIDQIRDCSELGLDGGRVITFAKTLQNMRRYTSYLGDYPEIDGKNAAADDNASLGAGAKWQDKLMLRLLVGDSKGPQTEPGWAARFPHPDGDREEEDVAPWPAKTGADILSLGLDEDAHEYGKNPAEAQARMTQYWQTAWTFASRIPGAAFCMTHNRGAAGKPYAGIVPGQAKADDSIFIANGGKVPFVLRKVKDTPYYRLIGECYIHGIMYGEAVSVQHEADVEVHMLNADDKRTALFAAAYVLWNHHEHQESPPANPINDPFVTAPTPVPPPLGPHRRFSRSDSQLSALGPNASPAQAKRALEAHLADTDRRIEEEAGKPGTALVQQRKQLDDRLRDVEKMHSEGELSEDLHQKLVEIEEEYNDVARGAPRAFLPKQRVPSNEAAKLASPFVVEGKSGRRSVSPSKFETQTTGSTTKLSVSSRKVRNQPINSTHDMELAVETMTSLISQVKNLQALLAEKEKELKETRIEKSRLEYEAESFQQRVKALDENEHRYKDENWNLETQLHDLITTQKAAVEREKKLTQNLNLLQAERNATQQELDEVRLSHSKLVEEHAAAVKRHDIELGTAKRNIVLADSERGAMQRKIEELTSQTQELAKAIYLEKRRTAEREQPVGLNDEGFDTANESPTPEDSPPPSPIKRTPRHSMLETETLKTSLGHAQRTIQSLRANYHREKTEKLELRRMLHEARDEVEKLPKSLKLLQAEKNAVQRELDTAKDNIATAEAERTAMQGRNDDLNSQIQELASDKAELEKKLTQSLNLLQAEKNAVQRELDAAKDTAEAERTAMQGRNDDLSSLVQELVSDKAELQRELEDLQQHVSTLAYNGHRYEEENLNLKTRLREAADREKELRRDLTSVDGKLNKCMSSHAELVNDLALLAKKAAKLQHNDYEHGFST
ncbi:hypothetical protein DL763_002203 [Monosporascus cannonballus]|nr:hypothetical protein DL763_002203 [Monosporascus cannonballus]